MSKITVNTDQVAAIAAEIEKLNNQLFDELDKSRKLFETLGNSWSGEAYDTSRSAYNDFAARYFNDYKKIIEQYINFLRTNVSQGYFEVENANISLGEAFK